MCWDQQDQSLHGRRLLLQKKQDCLCHIVQPDELQGSGVRHERLHGKSSETAQERTPAVSRTADNDGRAQNHPIQVTGSYEGFAGVFGRGKCRGLAFDADRREMHEPSHPMGPAGLNQCRDPAIMDAFRGFSRSILKRASAIHYCIDTSKQGTEILWRSTR